MTELTFKIVGPALDKMDWDSLQSHLANVGYNEEIHNKILGWLRRARSLIQTRPNKMSLKRDDFLTNFEAYAKTELGNDAATEVTNLRHDVGFIEFGYSQILEDRQNSPFGELSATERVAAIISAACRSVIDLNSLRDEHVERTGAVSTSPVLENELGQRIDLDGVNAAMVESTGMTLLIEAYGENWFNQSGKLILPEFDLNSDEQVQVIEIGLLNAMVWRRWKRAEELHRFLDGDLVPFHDEQILSSLPPNVTKIMAFDQNDATIELLDEIANDRVKHGMTQNFFEMKQQTNIARLSTGLSKPIGIGKGKFVSEAESHAAVALSSTMSAPIIDDLDEYAGLRLIEWLRGYAVLQQFAIDQFEASAVDGLMPSIQKRDLIELLSSFGLIKDKAEAFLERTSFGKSSRDLFDHPLIETGSGSILVFGPALLHGNLTGMLLSTLSNLKEDLQKKGHAFEAHIIDYLNGLEGVTAETRKVKRDGEEYDYDVLALWDDYIFHFECKTHGLSGGTPQRIFRFHQEARKDAKQTRRLADALVKHPDILEVVFGKAAEGKKVISCVLNALPYAVPGGIDGIPFYDASALGRFFEDRYLHIKTWHRGAQVDVMHRVGITDLWLAEKPSPERLVDEINDPVQVKIDLAHKDAEPLGLILGDETAAFIAEFVSKPMTDQSMADVFGVDVNSIREQQAEVTLAYQELRRLHLESED
ncbi:MAG: hypothetical protein HKN36_01985 [Hellea sp.]|nr:hypothetical protein [Hellea sp.]